MSEGIEWIGWRGCQGFREMTQEQARLRCASLAMLGGQYNEDAEALHKHFTEAHTMDEDMTILRQRCGGSNHWGGNTLGRRVPPALLAFAWPGAGSSDMMFHNCYPSECMFYPIHEKDARVRYSWRMIAKDIREMLGTERAKIKSANVDAFLKENRREPKEMTELTTTELHRIEMRIATHYQHAADELIGVGLCLIEVKEKKLVPHGQWESWLREHTGMSERNAQRLMAVAREVPQGSVLSTLPFSQVTAILALPEPEREPMAEKAADEGMSVRELQKAIKAMKEAEARAQGLEKTEAALRVKLEHQAKELEVERARIEQFRHKMAMKEQPEPATGISPEAQAEIDRLKAELEETEAYAEAQAEQRMKAQQEMLAMQSQATRGELNEMEDLTAFDLATAVRTFLGAAGVLPHMGATLAKYTEPDRQQMAQYIDMMAAWVEGARQALGTILVDL